MGHLDRVGWVVWCKGGVIWVGGVVLMVVPVWFIWTEWGGWCGARPGWSHLGGWSSYVKDRVISAVL